MALNDTPLAGQTLAQTRNPINSNFNVINAAFNVNHVDYNNADQGKHKWITYPRQGAAPVPPFGATEMSMYSLLNATSAVSELYIQRDTDAANAVPFTLSGAGASSGWTYLPSGMKIRWGQGTIPNGNANFSVAFAGDGFPGFTTNALAIQLTLIEAATAPNNNFVMIQSFNNLGILARRSTSNTSGALTFAYLAIGR